MFVSIPATRVRYIKKAKQASHQPNQVSIPSAQVRYIPKSPAKHSRRASRPCASAAFVFYSIAHIPTLVYICPKDGGFPYKSIRNMPKPWLLRSPKPVWYKRQSVSGSPSSRKFPSQPVR